MLLADDLAVVSLHGLLWVVQKIDEALEQQQEQEEEALQARLGELHQRLEAGQLTEQEFEAQEAELLDRLDAIAELREAAGDGAEGGLEDGSG